MERPAKAELARALAQHLAAPPAAQSAHEPAGFLLLSIKPHYADLIAVGFKRVEFRRRIPAGVKADDRVLFYLSSPVQAIGLTATISTICRAAPAALWRKTSHLAGIPKRDFDGYFQGATAAVGLVLTGVATITPQMSLKELQKHVAGFTAPQSGQIIKPDTGLWDCASTLLRSL